MRSTISGIQALKMVVDDFVRYFIWRGLNSDFQAHLVAITNKSKPSLTEINDSIFEATNRYIKQNCGEKNLLDVKRKTFNTPKTNSQEFGAAAVNVNRSDKPKIYCLLCFKDKRDKNHLMRDCPIYKSSRSKYDKLKQLKCCTKCSFSNHESNSCKFVFKTNCRFCNGPHMSYLCLKSNQTNSHSTIQEPAPDQETANMISFIEASQVSRNDPVILPTFTGSLVDENTEVSVRIFKDSG